MPTLTLNEYQQKAMTTCMPTCNNIAYMTMNLCGEVGELHSKLAKDIRKGKLFIGTSDRDKNGELILTQTFHNMSEEEIIRAAYLFYFCDADWQHNDDCTKIWDYTTMHATM